MQRVDLDKISQEEMELMFKQSKLLFKLNHTEPMTEEYDLILNELLDNNIGENSRITTPFAGAAFDKIKIGNNVFINSNCLAMARGGITIEDDVMIAGNVQLLSNNHDEYERQILTCEEIIIKKGAWIGAGATVLPGVSIGKYAIVGAGAIVTKDVPDYSVVVGIPAKVVKTLDKDKFSE
ncbi:MAG: galactoside O-acetyltransferase [Methanobrevibacter sp.]|uniref:acyltransferase n=1 Tax=Methanobrevibacter sp. TaxID=66852 RepID=UPI0025EB4A75|nr:DapH/DapD/GlmU-related protein [Methanobrevibacter sp.]MBE6509016.1 galactoside O-acetyltransferase [Methanobrevibacter sp.]